MGKQWGTQKNQPLWSSGSSFPAYFYARTFSMLATVMAPVVVAFAVLSTSAGVQGLAMVATVRTLALIAALPLAGFLADRMDSRTLVLFSHLLAGISQAVLALFLFLQYTPLYLLASVEAVNGIANALTLPVFSVILPKIIDKELLVRANSAIAMGRSASIVLGPIAATATISLINPAAGLLVNAVLFTLGGLIALKISVKTPQSKEENEQGFLSNVRMGWKDFSSRSWVWSVVLSLTLINAAFSGIQGVIGPAVALSRADIGELGWGILVAALGFGMFLAGTFLYKKSLPKPLIIGMLAVLPMALIPLGLLLELPLWIAAPFFVLAGAGIEVFTIAWMSALQSNIPVERLGRVSTFDAIGSYTAIPLGTSIAGIMTAASHVSLALIVALATICVATFFPLLFPSVRRITLEKEEQNA